MKSAGCAGMAVVQPEPVREGRQLQLWVPGLARVPFASRRQPTAPAACAVGAGAARSWLPGDGLVVGRHFVERNPRRDRPVLAPLGEEQELVVPVVDAGPDVVDTFPVPVAPQQS